MLIARYTANASGVVPIFNEGYQYTVNETSSNGVYTVELYSDTDFTSCSFAMKTDLLTIEYLKVTKTVTSLNSMFANCYSLTSINCSDWDTSNVINMNSVFLYCESLTELDVSNWDTSNVGTLNRTFYCCLHLKSLDLSNWKTTNVVDISYTFCYCSQMTELNLSGWNVDKVADTTMTFAYCNTLDTIKIYNCKANMISTLSWSSYFPTEVISGKTRTIYCDEALVGQIGPPTNWVLSSGKESNIKVVEYKFNNNMYNLIPEFNEGFTYTYEDIVEGNVTTRTIYSYSLPTKIIFGIDNDGEFGDNKSLSLLEVLSLNADNLNTYQRMFKACENVKSINCENVTINNAYEMFAFCCSLNTLNASSYDMSNATNINNMFYHCNNLTSLDISNWSLNDSVSTSNLFDSCLSLNSVIMNNSDCVSVNKIISQLPTKSSNSMGTLYVAGVSGSSQINTGDASIKYWNVSIEDVPEPPEYNIIARYTANASGVLPIFNDGYKYTVNETESNGIYTVELSSDDDFTSCMFNSKTNLLTVEYLKVTDKVTTLVSGYYGMFDGCLNLTSVNMDGWDTSGLTSMEYAFYDCKKLASLNGINNLNINNVKNMYYLFYNCSSLTQLDLSNWDTKNVTNMGYMFNGCTSLVQLDISNWDTSNTPNLAYSFNNCSKLNQITATNVSTSTLSKLITALPTRTSSSYGTINANNTTDELIASANAKYWNIGVSKPLIAKYTANASGVLPTFNDGYQYEVNETLSNGIYTVELYAEDDFTSCSFTNKTELLTVEYLKVTDKVTTFSNNSYGMFDSCSKLTYINTENWDTSNVTDMSYMFYACTSLVNLDINNWNVNNLTTMTYMFYNCNSLSSLDLSDWNTIKLNTVNGAFYYCSSLTNLDLSNWDTSNVTNISSMLYSCTNLVSLDISNFDLNKVSSIGFVFNGCSSLKKIIMNNSDYKSVNKVIVQLPTRTSDSMGTLDIEGVDDISQVNTATAESNYWNIESGIEQIKVAEYKFDNTLYDLFPEFNNGFTYTYEDIVEGNVTTRTIYSDSLPTLIRFGHPWVDEETDKDKANRAASLISISYLNTDNLTNASGMFRQCSSLIDINCDFNTSKVTNMSAMFQHCSKLTTLDLSNFNTSNVTLMNSMIASCSNLTSLDVSNFDTNNVTDMQYMFYNCNKLTTLDVSNFNTANVTNMCYMFHNCQKLTSLNVSNFNTTNVTDMSHMFRNCNNLTSLNVNDWDTSKVTDMEAMFDLCSRLVSLDLSNWNVSKVQHMGTMFGTCSSLKELNVSNWKTDSLTKTLWMFNKCFNLQELDLSSWNVNNVNDMYCMLSDCESLKQLNLSNWNLNNANIEGIFAAFLYGGCYNLNNIIMNNSNYNSVNKVIVQLPPRTSDSMGTLDITGIDDISQVDIATAESKFWNSESRIKIAEYKFNNTLYDLIPEFNAEFTDYTYKDENVVYEIIISDFNWELGGIDGSTGENTEFSDNTIYRNDKYIEVIPNTTIRVTPNTGQLLIDWYDENKIFISQMDRSHVNEIDVPDNAKYFRIWGGNIQENITELRALNSMITRTIYSNELPTVISFAGSTSLIECGYINLTNVNALSSCFQGCSSLIKIDSTNWDTSNITKIDTMCYLCSSLTEILGIEDWDTSSFGLNGETRAITAPFANCTSLTKLDLSKWVIDYDVSANSMFTTCTNLVEISLPKFNGKINILGMFMLCPNLKEIKGLENIKVLSSGSNRRAFEGCSSLEYISMQGLDASEATNLNIMFKDCSSLVEIDFSNAKFSENVDLSSLFSNCSSLQKINLTNVNNVTFINNVISQLPTRTADSMGTLDITGIDDISQVDIATAESKFWNVTDKMLIARYTANASGVIPTFNEGYQYTVNETSSNGVYTVELYSDTDFTSCSFNGKTELLTVEYLKITDNITNMNSMFCDCTNLISLDVSNWDTGNVTDMGSLFGWCTNLTSLDVSKWDTSEVTNMAYTFFSCQSLASLDVSKWDTSKVTTMESMFYECSKLASLDVSDWDTDNVTDMYSMFYACKSLASLDLSNFNTSRVINMDYMFSDCESLTSLDVSNFNTSLVKYMGYMFDNCNKLTSLNVSSFNTTSVLNMYAMFSNCLNLSSLDVSNFDTSLVKYMGYMFNNCNKLTSLDVSNWDTSKVTNMNSMFNNCNKLTSIDLSNFDTGNVTDIANMFNNCSSLTSISMNNSDYNSVNKIIAELPDKSMSNIDFSQFNVMQANEKNWKIAGDINGTLDITGVDSIHQVNIADAEAKNWVVVPDVDKEFVNAINIGNKALQKLYIGSEKISKIYLGDHLIYGYKE